MKKEEFQKLQQNKILYVDQLRKLLNEYDRGEISISRFAEIINQYHLTAVEKKEKKAADAAYQTGYWHGAIAVGVSVGGVLITFAIFKLLS